MKLFKFKPKKGNWITSSDGEITAYKHFSLHRVGGTIHFEACWPDVADVDVSWAHYGNVRANKNKSTFITDTNQCPNEHNHKNLQQWDATCEKHCGFFGYKSKPTDSYLYNYPTNILAEVKISNGYTTDGTNIIGKTQTITKLIIPECYLTECEEDGVVFTTSSASNRLYPICENHYLRPGVKMFDEFYSGDKVNKMLEDPSHGLTPKPVFVDVNGQPAPTLKELKNSKYENTPLFSRFTKQTSDKYFV